MQLSRDTLRYYERLKLIERPPRSSGGYRVYGETALERLKFIKHARQFGCSLTEIRQLLDQGASGRCRRFRDLLAKKLLAVDEQLRTLRAFRGLLVGRIQDCDAAIAERPDEDCPVLRSGAHGLGPLTDTCPVGS